MHMLIMTSTFPEIKCPKCKQGHDIEWNTEYGELIYGWHDTECVKCSYEFKFHAHSIEIYETRER